MTLMFWRRFALACGVGLASAPALWSQEILYTLGPGKVAGTVGDVDGDTHRDFVLDDGVVRSGADGSAIRSHTGGTLVSAGGGPDFTGDGVSDYALLWRSASMNGQAVLYSGADGSVVLDRSITGAPIEGSVGLTGDLDGDGRGELLLGILGELISSIDSSVRHSFSGVGPWMVCAGDVDGDLVDDVLGTDLGSSRAVVFSGASGLPWQYYGPAGDVVRAWDTGDVDADGIPDVLCTRGGGGVFCYSGADGSELRAWPPDQLTTPAFVGDADGDGYEDVAMGDALSGLGDEPLIGRTRLHSGRTGHVFYNFVDHDHPAGGYGWTPRGLGDLDGDGRDELLVGGLQQSIVVRGAALYLDIWPRLEVEQGESILIHTAPGPEGNLAILFVSSVNGSPFQLLLTRGSYQWFLAWHVPALIPPGLAGLDLGFRAFGLDAQGKIATHAQEEILRLR